jgi:hypothetical protein
MGGELQVPDGSCRRCNEEFGRCEAAIKDSTKFLLNLLQIENRYGDVPSAKVDVEIRGISSEGLFGYREGTGEVNLSDVVIEKETAEGKKQREGFFISKESAEKFLARARARGDHVNERQVPEDLVLDASYTLTLPFAFSVDTRKVVAKIALGAIAYQYGLEYALSSQFDDLRQVLAKGNAQDLRVRIFANHSFMAAHSRTAYQHSVMCHLSAGAKRGCALVTLFGGLSYTVEVTRNYAGRISRQFSIFYDAAAKTPLNPIVLADEMALIRKVLSAESKFEDRDAVNKQWFPIIAAYCADAGVQVERITTPDFDPP